MDPTSRLEGKKAKHTHRIRREGKRVFSLSRDSLDSEFPEQLESTSQKRNVCFASQSPGEKIQ
jgi:hypothetical protein